MSAAVPDGEEMPNGECNLLLEVRRGWLTIAVKLRNAVLVGCLKYLVVVKEEPTKNSKTLPIHGREMYPKIRRKMKDRA